MGIPATIPIFAPDGSTGEVPSNRVADALNAGGKLALRVTAPDGSTGLVPHDQLGKAVAAGARPSGVGQPPAPPSDVDLAADVPAWQQVANFAKGLGKSGLAAASSPAGPTGTYSSAINQMNSGKPGPSPSTPQSTSGLPEVTPEGTAQKLGYGTGVAAQLAAGAYGGYRAATALLPSASRAGRLFQAASALAGDSPIDPNTAGRTALEIKDMADAGGTMPKVVSKFLARVTDPTGEPVTYDEARRFYQNASRLSANQYGSLNPNMQRLVGKFAGDLGQSIQSAAESAGAGDLHADAMQQYRNLSSIRRLKSAANESVLQPAIKGAAAGVGAGSVYGLYNLMRK